MKPTQIRTFIAALSFLIGLLHLISCQKILGTYTPVYYNIANKTNQHVSVCYTYNPHDGGQRYDSIINIEAGQERILLVQLFADYPENPKTQDTLSLISQLLVFDGDAAVSPKNFRLTKYWEFIEYPTKCELDLNINPEDF